VLIALLRDVSTKGERSRIGEWISNHGPVFMFIVALIAVVGSLFFSEIAQFTPCRLCWFQRIFMYPQLLLLLIALWKKDKKIAPYILALCIIGALFSVQHYIEQLQAIMYPAGGSVFTPCDTSGISCASTQILTFGYITIPLMAMTAFVINGLAATTMLVRRHDR